MLPILLDVPMPIVTERLLIREPRVGDGAAINQAIAESFAELNRWMPWCRKMPTVEESESFSREGAAKFITRQDLQLRIWSKDGSRVLGSTGLHPQPGELRAFEIGYWIRTADAGNGLMTEAVRALTRYAFERLDAVRVLIRADVHNRASRRVAEKAGFELEGTLRCYHIRNDGSLGDMCVYSTVRPPSTARVS